MENLAQAQALEEEIIEVWRTLTLSQKQSIIQLIHSFQRRRARWSEEDIQAYNKEIDEAEDQIARGEYVTHEQVMKEAKKW